MMEAQKIFDSGVLNQIRKAHDSGQVLEVIINGRKITYDPNIPASGLSFFGENSFYIGREAFKSADELEKTVLHELQRLYQTKSSTGVYGQLAKEERDAAFNFSQRAYETLKNLKNRKD